MFLNECFFLEKNESNGWGHELQKNCQIRLKNVLRKTQKTFNFNFQQLIFLTRLEKCEENEKCEEKDTKLEENDSKV